MRGQNVILAVCAALALAWALMAASPSPAMAGGVVASAETPAGALVQGGTLVFEASSSHISIQLYWDDTNRQRTSFRYLTIVPLAADKNQMLWRLLIGSGRDVARTAARGEAEARWEKMDGFSKEGTPESALQYAIAIAPEEVDQVKAAMNQIEADKSDKTLSGYARYGVAAFINVARAAGFKQQVASNSVVELFPDPSQFGATPVSWLYGLMQLNSGGPGAQLEGCSTKRFLSPADLERGFLDRLGEGLGSNVEQRIAIGFFGIVRLYTGLSEYIAKNDVAADLLPFLQFDPVMVDIYDCQMLQAMRGGNGYPESIVGRSQIYRAFDDYLVRIDRPEDGGRSPFAGGEPPRFFRAAYLVTRPLGVSFVDLLERQSPRLINLLWKQLFGIGDAFDVIDLAEPPDLPSARTITTLREINIALFELNRGIMRRLYAHPGRIFDPLDTNNPAMVSYGKAAAFDLRMVIAEQLTIERYLQDKRPGQQTIRQLTEYSRILPAVSVDRVFKRDDGKPWQHLKQIKDVYAAVSATGIRANFADFKYRVAIGSAYVLTLHGRDPSTELKPYLDRLWPTLKPRPRDVEARALDDRIRALLAAPDILPVADGGQSPASRVQAGVTAFLAPAVVTGWLDCAAGHDLAHEELPKGIASAEARRAFLSRFGPAAAIAAYELLPQGGAIDGATRPPTKLAPKTCAAIHARFIALQCALQATSTDGCKAEFAASVRSTSDDDNDAVFLFEESVAAKTYSVQLGPFFSAELAKTTAVAFVVEQARVGANEYARKTALFAALDAASERALSNYGAGITVADLAPPRALFAASKAKLGTQSEEGFRVNDAAVSQLANDLSKSRLAATIEQRLAALAPLLAKLGAYYDPSRPIVFADPSDDPVAKSTTSVTEEIIPLIPETVGDTVLALQATLAEAGIELKLSPVGMSTNGIPLHDVSVSYRMPTSSSASACPVAAPTPCIGGAEEIVPLGISIHRVVKTASGGLQTTALAGEQDTDLDGAEATAALHRLGLPSIFSVHGLDIQSSRDLKQLSLSFGIDVAGLSVPGLTLPIIKDGVAVDVRGALEAAVRQKIESLDIERSFAQLSLPELGKERRGIWLAPDPTTASLSFDWPGQVLTVRIGYGLGFGPDRRTLISAAAELLATDRGFEIRQLSFDSSGAESFTADLLERTGLAGALKDQLEDIAIDPEYGNGKLSLAVAGNFTMGTCKTAVLVRVPADEIGDEAKIVNRITTSGEEVARDVANCVMDRALDGVKQLLEAKSLRLLGITLAIDNAEQLTQQYALNPGLTELRPTLQLVDDRDCGELKGPANGAITGAVIRIANGSVKLDLSGIAAIEAEAQLLGRAVECRLRSMVAPGGTLDVRDFQISGEIFSAAVTLRELPWLGDISLGRVNISALGTEDPGKILSDAVGAALEARVSAELERRLESRLAMPGIGDFSLLPGGIKVSLFGDKAGIEIKGQVNIQSIKAIATIRLPFKGLPGSASVSMDPEQSLQDSILGAIGGLLPFGGDQVQITPPRLERLDANGRRFGLVFGATANFAMEPSDGFKIEIKRIIITDQDVRLGGQIRLRLGYDLEFVYFAITDITVIYDTGEGGGRKGVILQASVAPLASALKYIIKLEGELDLRELHSKRFTLDAALILINSLDLMVATGTIDLDKSSITFDARTAPAVAAVLDIQGTGKLLGEEGIASANAIMGILGVKLSQTELLACSKRCEDLPEAEMLRVRVHQNLLIGDASLLGTTDFELNDPRIGGSVDLDLFGWRPASATLDASLASVVAKLRFIGIGVTVITPSIETMTPGLLADILKSLLDVDLSSLLKLKLNDITVSLMHGDGSVTTTKPNANEGKDNGQKPGGDGVAQSPDPGSSDPKQYINTTPDPGEAVPKTEPQFPGINERFGEATVQAIYCEKVFGTGASWPPSDGDRFEFWVYEQRDASERLYSGHTHPDPAKVTWHDWTFDAASAGVICDKAVNPVHELNWEKFPRVGVGRQISVQYQDCTGNVPSIGLWGLVGTDVGNREKYVTSYKPVLCWQKDNQLYDLRVRLLHNGGGFLGLVECTAPTVAPKWLEDDPLFRRACRERSGLLDLGTLGDVKDGLLTASQEFTLIDIRARHLLTTGQNAFPEQTRAFQVPLTNGAIDVTVYPVFDRDNKPAGSRVLMQGPDGKTLTRTLTQDDPLGPWLESPGFQQEIVALWFAEGRHPVVDFERPGTDLVLSSGDGRRFWFWREDPASPIVEKRTLFIDPAKLRGVALSEFLEALPTEVRMLREPGVWTAYLGIAQQSDIRLYVLKSATDQVRILLDLDREPVGAKRLAGDFSANDRSTRRICQASAQLSAALADGLGTAGAGLSLDAILGAPDELLKLGPPIHPLIIIRQQPQCG